MYPTLSFIDKTENMLLQKTFRWEISKIIPEKTLNRATVHQFVHHNPAPLSYKTIYIIYWDQI